MNTCELKKLYIPQCVKGAVSISQAARLIGCTRQTVINLKKRFRDIGEKAFIHGSKGRRSPNAVNAGTKKTIIEFYRDKWNGAPFSVFVDFLRQEKKIFLSYPTITKILHEAGIFSPVGYYKTPEEKRLHKPRKERPTEGELVQIDGCSHDWFLDGSKETIHGAIDDATHKIVSLYMTKNECSLGYFRMTRNIINKFGGPRAFYSGKFYDVVLDDTIADLHGGKLSQVEQDLFSRFFLSDKHSSFAKIG